MFPVYPQDLSEITFILSPQPAIILDSSTWLKINSSWTRQKCRDDVGCCSFLCLQHLSPVTFKCWGSHTPHILPSTTPEFTGTFFPPFGLLNSFPLSSCSLSLLLSVPLRFSPEIVSKEAEVIASLPCLRVPQAFKCRFKCCQSMNFAVRDPVRALSLLEFFPPRWNRNNNTYLIELWGFPQMLFARHLVQRLALSGYTQENAVTVLPVTFKRRLLVTLTVFLALFSVPCFSVENFETCVRFVDSVSL